MNRTKQGFSLIELMIVLLIISILACFAYPTYKQYIARTHRLDGQTALWDLANRMELYYSKHHTYEKATIATNNNTDILYNNRSPGGWYTLAIVDSTTSTFELQATATVEQANQDPLCQSLTLTNRGEKISVNASCW